MKNNFEFGTPVHIPEDPNSLEKPSLEEYNEYFEELYKKQAAQRVDNNRIGCRVDPETYHKEVDRAEALKLQLAISDRKSDELELVNADLVQEKIILEQKSLELEQKYTIVLAKLAELERTNALLLGQLPVEPLSRNQSAQKLGQTASKFSF